MHIAESIITKLALAAIITIAGPQCHMWWGQHQHQFRSGVGPQNLGLLYTIAIVSAVVAGCYLLLAGGIGALLRKRGRLANYSTDLFLFAIGLSGSAWTGIQTVIK